MHKHPGPIGIRFNLLNAIHHITLIIQFFFLSKNSNVNAFLFVQKKLKIIHNFFSKSTFYYHYYHFSLSLSLFLSLSNICWLSNPLEEIVIAIYCKCIQHWRPSDSAWVTYFIDNCLEVLLQRIRPTLLCMFLKSEKKI